jgi:hypothetical protein
MPADCLHVLDPRGLEEDVRDRDEQRTLVDRSNDRFAVGNDDDVQLRLRLVQVAHAREVPLLVDDAIAAGVDRAEAREDDRLGDRDVLVHHRRPGRRADDAPDLVADRERHLPPSLRPGADTALLPCARVLGDAILCGCRHRAERMVDQIRRLRQDRKAIPVRRQIS